MPDAPGATPPATRARLLLLACVPLRASAGVAALLAPRAARPYLGAVAAALALGFVSSIARGRAGTLVHGGFGGEVWWARLRYVHLAAWATAAALLLARAPGPAAGLVLLADALLGALAGAAHYGRRAAA
jgi:hypothetical protein